MALFNRLTSNIVLTTLRSFITRHRAPPPVVTAPPPVRRVPLKVEGPVLFLDFDGVLHPGYSGTLRHLPMVERMLINNPEVQVVVSSDWRLSRSLGTLQQLFSSLIAHRVIAVTPVLPGRPRAEEIALFCELHQVERWAILDDAAEEFPIGDAHLVLTDKGQGLTPYDLERVVGLLYPRC